MIVLNHELQDFSELQSSDMWKQKTQTLPFLEARNKYLRIIFLDAFAKD